MKNRKFRGIDIEFYRMYPDGYITLIPTIEYRHKYWYLWSVDFVFLKWVFRIEISRKDWNDYTEDQTTGD